jgi:hypothetical protein
MEQAATTAHTGDMVTPLAHALEIRNQALAMLRDGVRNTEVGRVARHPHRYGGLLEAPGPTHVIACADVWPGLMDECEAAMRAVMPHNNVNRVAKRGMHEVKAYSRHWPCLFPQHGPGRKHERSIVLERWQREIVDEFPEEFVRGLIHSDGCRVLNSAVRTKNGRTTRYFYSRYHFTNESAHIRDLFTGALDRLGIEWRKNRRNCISIARRESVRRLDEFVGPKH